MAAPVSSLSVALQTLPPGFHARRFAAGDVGFEAYIWRGAAPGPVLLVNGATHGDEYEGPETLRRWADTWRPRRLRGTVVFVPVLNEGAFFAGLRCHPGDGGNLARAFPGDPDGGPTARLAHLFDMQLLAQATHYVDLHSAGRAYELLPWTGFITHAPAIDRTQRRMAACFDRFWCWAGPFLPGRTLSAAHARRVPAVYVECRGRGAVDPRDLRALDRGLKNLLRVLGLVPSATAPRLARQRTRTTTDADEAHLQIHHSAPHDGLFVPAVAVGARVRRGDVLGTLQTLAGPRAVAIRAARAGRVVMLRFQRSVPRGEALCTLAPI